jgi:hypothetical protein
VSGFDPEDLDSLFDTDDLAVEALITGPSPFTKTVNAILDMNTLAIDMYGETSVEASDPWFECKSIDLADVKRGMSVRFPNLESHEDGYGKSFEVARIASAGVQTSRVYLKEA